MSHRSLVALPVFNEVRYVNPVLDEVRRFASEVLVVDDGSTDGTASLLATRDDVRVETHAQNRGYGAGLRTAFNYAIEHSFDVLVTIDRDGQHQPKRIPDFVRAADRADIVSGSRYLREFAGDSQAPTDRRQINQQITAELNGLLALNLTDAFCGFKAYRVSALKELNLTEDGYAMPIELWVQAAHAGLNVIELPVRRIYLPEERSFGGSLDDSATRLDYYREVLNRSLAAVGNTHPADVAICGGVAG